MRRMQQSAVSLIALIFCTSGVLVVSEQNVLAQVTTAITPSGLNTQVSAPTTLPNGQVNYNITGGTRPGNGTNLFLSFGQFSIGTNNIANFLNDSGLATSNILGRVTGGNVSNIFGTIQTTGFGNANLFLMNPAGFLFGPNATVNVGGLMTFTSADYLRLADGARLKAVPNAAADALLSASPVAAFGFLGSNPGAITVQGSQLAVADGTGISLVSGNITIQSGTLDNGTVQPARLSAPSGQINLVSVGRPRNPAKGGELSATDFGLSPALGFKSLGTVNVMDGAIISASADGSSGLPGGVVMIRGGELLVSYSSLTAEGGPNFAGGSAGGTIEVHAGTVTLDHATISASGKNSTDGSGGQILFQDLRTLSSTASTLAVNAVGEDSVSRGGSITIGSSTTQSVTLTDTALFANTNRTSFCCGGPLPVGGNAGDITVTGRQLIINGGLFDTSAGPESIRDGGLITLNGNQITLANQASLQSREKTGGGGGGTIILQGLMSTDTAPSQAKSVTVDNSSIITSSSSNSGGNILIHANDVTLNNALLQTSGYRGGGTINLADVKTLKSTNSILNSSDMGVSGVGGTIVLGSLSTNSIMLQDTTLSVRGNTFIAPTAGGTIRITATKRFQSVGSTLDASSEGGNGGTVSIQAGRLSLTDGSTVTALGAGPGKDGTIQFEFGKSLTLQDSVTTPAATIVSDWDGK